MYFVCWVTAFLGNQFHFVHCSVKFNVLLKIFRMSKCFALRCNSALHYPSVIYRWPLTYFRLMLGNEQNLPKHTLETSYLCSYKSLTAKGIVVSRCEPLTSFLSIRVIYISCTSIMYLISLYRCN